MALSLRDTIKEKFDIYLPISGGYGRTIEDAIIIDKNYKNWSDVEYSCIRLLYQGKEWRLVDAKLIDNDGQKYDRMEISITGDSDQHFYFFNVTNHFH